MWTSRLILAGLLAATTHAIVASQGQDDPRRADAHLQDAITRGDVKAVNAALNEGARPGFTYGPCQTPLHLAASRGPVDVLRLLLNAPGVAADTYDDEGRTPLHFAAAAGNLAAIQMLVRAKADPNARYWTAYSSCLDDGTHQEGGDTPLLVALKHKKFDAARMLIEAGADPQMPNAANQTPLLLAAAANHMPLFRLLLDRGGDVHLTSASGDGPLSAAAANGNLEMVRTILLRHPVLNRPDSLPLQRAARAGHLPVVKALVEADAPVTNAVLAQAAMSGKADVLAYVAGMLRSRVGPDANVMSALLLVAGEPDARAEAIRVFRPLIGSVDVEGDCGRTPLVAAARIGNAAVVKALLEAGADANRAERTDDESCIGTSALIAAAAYPDVTMMDALLEAGARVTYRDGLAWNAVEAFDAAARYRGMSLSETQKVRQTMENKARRESAEQLLVATSSSPPSHLSLHAINRVAASRIAQSPNRARWARIAETSSKLADRWNAVTIGLSPRNANTNGVPALWPRNQVEYRASLAQDLALIDVASRSEDPVVLDLVADDLDTKLADCEAAGEDAAGEDIFVTFKLNPDVPKTDFRLFYKSRLLLALDRARRHESQYGQSQNLGPSSVKIPPGSYIMFARSDSTGARTPCVRVTVGRNASREVTFATASANPANTCVVP
jgi:ankyrin repeat protein